MTTLPGKEIPEQIIELEEKAAAPPGRGIRLLRILLPLAVLVAGALVCFGLLETGPQAKTQPQVRNATLVEVQPVEFGPQATQIEAMGTVKAARQVELTPQVSGAIMKLNEDFIPGGHFQAGERLLQIDPTDYQVTVRQLASDVAQAKSEIELEQGNQLVAQREYELLGEPVSATEKSLMLRKPQLENLKAALDASQAKLDQARIDLQRTEIKAPFNAVVQARDVNLGSRVTASTALATLVGTDAYWVEVSVPVSQLRWIVIPKNKNETGSLVKIYDQAAWGKDGFRTGRVIRLAADLESEGRMARILVQVADPLALNPENAKAPRLLLGSYVRVTIEGRQVANAAALGREQIRDGDQVWIMDAANQLDIRHVDILYRGKDQVLISTGIDAGERLVVSDLSAPIQGMSLRLKDDSRNSSPADQVVTSETRQQGEKL